MHLSQLNSQIEGRVVDVLPVKEHPCQLPQLATPTYRHIADGVFVKLRRSFRTLFMADHENSEAKAFLRSTAKISEEQERQLRHYYFLIHPFSKFRVFWETFMIPVYIALFFLIPAEITTIHTSDIIIYSKFFCDICCHVDIIFFFFTGYFDKDRQLVEMKPEKIAKRYLKTYFFFDLASSQPIKLYLKFFTKEKYHYIEVILCLKIVRLKTLMNYVKDVCLRRNFWSHNMKIISFVLWFTIVILWFFTGYFVIVSLDGHAVIDSRHQLVLEMLKACMEVVRALMLIGARLNLSDIKYNNNEEIRFGVVLFRIFLMIFGAGLQMIILAALLQIYNKRCSSKNKYNNLIQQIREYVKYKELPTRLRQKIYRYIDFKYKKNIFKESDILNSVSQILRQDILLYNCKTMVEKVPFFKDLPTSVVLTLVSKLRSEVYLSNDIIVQAGTTGNSMYFIYMGTVAVYTSTGKEICHLEDGDHFGEIALVINEPRVATVVAVRECELFRLNRRDFQEAIRFHSKLSNKIRIQALSRLEDTMKMENQEQD